MATILFPLVFAIVGALVYAFAANPKLQEMGKWTFICGMFWLVYVLSHTSLHV